MQWNKRLIKISTPFVCKSCKGELVTSTADVKEELDISDGVLLIKID